MPDARRTLALSPHPPTAPGRREERATAVPPSMRARRVGRHEVRTDAPAPELVGLLGHLRAALTRYVGGRRAEGAPLARVLAEVQDLVRAAAACDGWWDVTDLLVLHATRWTLEAYASEGSRAARA